MSKKKNLFFWILLFFFIAIALFFGLRFYYFNYYLPNKEPNITKFSITDLKDEKIYYKCSKEYAISVLGEPVQIENSTDANTNKQFEVLSYDNVLLYFYNNELFSFYTSSEQIGFKNIKVGDNVDKVLNSFYNESKDTYTLSSTEKIIGKYIYGNFGVENLGTINTSDSIFYAYTTKTSDDISEYDLIYAYMCPSYSNGAASQFDVISQLKFHILDEKISYITWSVGPYKNEAN